MPDNNVLLGGVAIDITEQKESEQALEESYTKFKNLADYTYDWEYLKDTNNNHIYLSPSCERIAGYKAEEFIENPHLFNSLIIDDNSELWATHENDAKNQIACKRPFEFKIKTKKGKIKWISHVCRPVYDAQGKHIGNRGTNRDVTVQKLSQIALTESELRFKQLSDLAFEGIIVHKNGIVQNVNNIFGDFFSL